MKDCCCACGKKLKDSELQYTDCGPDSVIFCGKQSCFDKINHVKKG